MSSTVPQEQCEPPRLPRPTEPIELPRAAAQAPAIAPLSADENGPTMCRTTTGGDSAVLSGPAAGSIIASASSERPAPSGPRSPCIAAGGPANGGTGDPSNIARLMWYVPPYEPEGLYTADVVINAARGYAEWVTFQHPNDIVEAFKSLDYQEAKDLLWSAFDWPEEPHGCFKPPCPPASSDTSVAGQHCNATVHRIRWSTYSLWAWVDRIPEGIVLLAGTKLDPKFPWYTSEHARQTAERPFLHQIPTVCHIIYRFWLMHSRAELQQMRRRSKYGNYGAQLSTGDPGLAASC
jgi:hypothetical protein